MAPSGEAREHLARGSPEHEKGDQLDDGTRLGQVALAKGGGELVLLPLMKEMKSPLRCR